MEYLVQFVDVHEQVKSGCFLMNFYCRPTSKKKEKEKKKSIFFVFSDIADDIAGGGQKEKVTLVDGLYVT